MQKIYFRNKIYHKINTQKIYFHDKIYHKIKLIKNLSDLYLNILNIQ